MGRAKPGGPLLIVGLGNPGPRYDGTRHNAGAAAVSRLAVILGMRMRPSIRNQAWVARAPGAVLARPASFMNECGPVVARLASAYRAPAPLVVSDDLDLPLGSLRFRTKGSAGGHNGIASVIAFLGTSEFPRLKIGIGRPARKEDVVDYVLSRFEGEERASFDSALDRAAAALERAVKHGLGPAMTELSA